MDSTRKNTLLVNKFAHTESFVLVYKCRGSRKKNGLGKMILRLAILVGFSSICSIIAIISILAFMPSYYSRMHALHTRVMDNIQVGEFAKARALGPRP